MNIDSINNGFVLDHIEAGKAMEIYESLGLSKLDCPVAMIMNVKSGRMGKKDIIKIDAPIDINLDVLGFIDSGITVNVIENGVLIEKRPLSLPVCVCIISLLVVLILLTEVHTTSQLTDTDEISSLYKLILQW